MLEDGQEAFNNEDDDSENHTLLQYRFRYFHFWPANEA